MKVFAVAAVVLSAGVAQAGGPVVVADEPEIVAPAAPAADMDWTGFYVGLSAISGSFDDSTTSTDTQGYGLQLGYLRDIGRFVYGGELAYASGDYDAFPTSDWTSTRLKLIGGFDAGRLLPYGFVGVSNYDISGPASFSDTVTIYGLGAKFAVTPKIALGLEYLVENKDDFDGTGADVESSELALRLDYRF